MAWGTGLWGEDVWGEYPPSGVLSGEGDLSGYLISTIIEAGGEMAGEGDLSGDLTEVTLPPPKSLRILGWFRPA